MRGELGLPPLTLETVVTMVGEGARLLVERALGPGFSSDQINQNLKKYLAYYDEVCLDATRAYPGVEAMLAELTRRYPLALLSNKGGGVLAQDPGRIGSHRLLPRDPGRRQPPHPQAGPRRPANPGRPARTPHRAPLIGGRHLGRRRDRPQRRLRLRPRRVGLPRPEKLEGVVADLRVKTAAELVAALAMAG